AAAPCSICVHSALEAPKLSSTRVPVRRPNSAPSSVKASVSDDAAYTVRASPADGAVGWPAGVPAGAAAPSPAGACPPFTETGAQAPSSSAMTSRRPRNGRAVMDPFAHLLVACWHRSLLAQSCLSVERRAGGRSDRHRTLR